MDSIKPKDSFQKEGPLLIQNKIPSEMLASYQPSVDFEPVINDFQQMGFDTTSGQFDPYSQYYPFSQNINLFYPYTDPQIPFANKFPRTSDYSNGQLVAETFPHLANVNDPNFDLESISPNAQFYIMRSGNDDNIHKAIKYHIWSTTASGKSALRQAWQEFEDNGLTPEIYLIFSVVTSNQFLGVAKMISNVNDEETFKYWWESCKWFGTFQLKWLFIKDIHHANFEHIIEGEYNAPVVYSKDSTPISAISGKMILQTFKEHLPRPNILESFEYMDRREDQLRSQRDNNPEFEKFFEDCCESYKNDPDGYQPLKKTYYNKKSSKKSSNSSYNKNYKGNYYGNTNRPAHFKKAEIHSKTWQAANKQAMNLEDQFFVKKEGKDQKKMNENRNKVPQKGEIEPIEMRKMEENGHRGENGKNGYSKPHTNGAKDNGHAEKHS